MHSPCQVLKLLAIFLRGVEVGFFADPARLAAVLLAFVEQRFIGCDLTVYPV